ncbi:hypothetical protein F4801DRAFT_550294 [Xylaria longipes]|nr:hypothetical protein F4801DRAFT_550294 [Xylaria longipes]
MAITNNKQVKEGKKAAVKQVKEKKIRKSSNPSKKRGQPTAAARLISSPYVKFGWHKPLGGDIKETVQHISSMADSMYMLQISRDRPIDSLSLRNGIFWEHRQLADESIVSTPALDHIDLFPVDDESFQDTLRKISKQPFFEQEGFLLHYLFETLRSREFLLLATEVCGEWVTIITRTRPRIQSGSNLRFDREVTDLAIIDPQPSGRQFRRELINRRLPLILEEGCIQLSTTELVNSRFPLTFAETQATVRDIVVPNLASDEPSNWQSGLVAWAISHEFLRRLKILQFRRSRATGSSDEDFLWAAFEEQYNFDTYRENLISACAHQTIETSGYRVRLALEVPSDDSNYQPSLLQDEKLRVVRDEKWEIFQSPTHTLTVGVNSGAPNLEAENHHVMKQSPIPPVFTTPSYTSPSVSEPASPACSPTSARPNAPTSPQSIRGMVSPGYSPTSPAEWPPAAPPSPVFKFTEPAFSPSYSPTSPATPDSSTCDELMGTEDDKVQITETEGRETVEEAESRPIETETSTDVVPRQVTSDEDQRPEASTSHQSAPVAPMGPHELSPQIPGLTLKSPELLAEDQSALQPQEASRKQPLSDDGHDEEPPAKRVKIEDES